MLKYTVKCVCKLKPTLNVIASKINSIYKTPVFM